MFTYWPIISLVVAGVMVTVLLLLKFADKLCRARMVAVDGVTKQQDRDQYTVAMEDMVMDDGAGTMMDFNLQETGSVRSQRTAQSQVGYSPASEGGAPQQGYRREVAL